MVELNKKIDGLSEHPGRDMARALLRQMHESGVQIQFLDNFELILSDEGRDEEEKKALKAFLDMAKELEAYQIDEIEHGSDREGAYISFLDSGEEKIRIYEDDLEYRALLVAGRWQEIRDTKASEVALSGIRQGEAMAVKDSTRVELRGHEERVADEARKSNEKPQISADNARILKSLDSLRKSVQVSLEDLSSVERMSEQDRKNFVYGVRAKLMEAGELLSLFEANLSLGEGESHLFEVDGQSFDLNGIREDLQQSAEALASVQGDSVQESLSLFDDIEAQRDQISVRQFKELSIEERLLMVSNLRSWNELSEKTLIVFNFGTNEKLEYQVGLGDLMPPSIRQILWNGTSYQRRGNQGFYNSGQYLPIFTGTEVRIEKEDENYNSGVEYAERFGVSKVLDQTVSGLKVEQKIPENKISQSVERNLLNEDVLKISEDFMVDADLLLAVVTYVKGDDYNEIDDDYEFLNMAARYLQNAEMKYEQKHGPDSALEAVSGEKRYKVEFLVFALDHFNLFNEYRPKKDTVIEAVVEQYGLYKGVDLKFEEKHKVVRNERVNYDTREMAQATEAMKERAEQTIDALRDHYMGLVERGEVTQEFSEMMIKKSEEIYTNMISHLGSSYQSRVEIMKPNGKVWRIRNVCTGGAMKAFDGIFDLRLQSGTQKGKPISNFYWGNREDWLNSMVENSSAVKRVKVDLSMSDEEIDRLVGGHLAPGEIAPAGFSNHAGILFKDPDGRVMMYHSGADLRPNRIPWEEGREIPYGYEQKSGVRGYVFKRRDLVANKSLSRRQGVVGKMSSSKVNIIPLATYFKRMKPPGMWVRFLPLHEIV